MRIATPIPATPNRVVLIFGGAGFVGSNWAHHLLTKTDATVQVFDNVSRRNVEHNLRWLQKLPESKARLRVTIADVRDMDAVKRAVATATEIYHFAAQVAVTTSLEDPRADFDVNAGGTLNILEAARLCGTRPFLLFTSTNKVYGQIGQRSLRAPLDRRWSFRDGIRETQLLDFYSPSGCSKGTADQYVHDYARIFGIPTVVFRVSCIAGPRQFGTEDQGWVAHFVYSSLQKKTIAIYGDGRQVRDVLAIQDLLRAFSAAYENRQRTAGQVYNIGGGPDNTISLLELISLIESALNVRVQYRFRPARPGDQAVYVTDFEKFARHARWLPERSVEQIVYDLCHWYKSNESLFIPTPFPLPAAPLPTLPAESVREIAS
jgi:CDP-paratose 2-epimerase